MTANGQISFLPAEDGVGNAVISPDDPHGCELYFTLIGCGSNDEQNALAARIVRAVNAHAQMLEALREARDELYDQGRTSEAYGAVCAAITAATSPPTE